MQLKVQPQYGPPFETQVKTAVSKIAIPRVGDKINIKYNPANTTELIVI
jgi:TATA-binding protein-associated factor Taf7